MYIDNNSNHEFSISGMDDNIRNNYKYSHPIGTIISYSHSGETSIGKPRFARYIRIREDVVIKEIDTNDKTNINNIISIFNKIIEYEKTQSNGTFKIKAYSKAIKSLKSLNNDNEILSTKLEGVG